MRRAAVVLVTSVPAPPASAADMVARDLTITVTLDDREHDGAAAGRCRSTR